MSSPEEKSEATKLPIRIEFTLTMRVKHDSTQRETSEDKSIMHRWSTNEAADNSLRISDSNIKPFAREDFEPHNTSLQINIQENIGMPDPKLQQKLLNNLTSLQGNNEEGKRPRLRTLAPKPPPEEEARSRSDSGASADSEEPFPDFDPNFPSLNDEQSWDIMSDNNNFNMLPQLNSGELPHNVLQPNVVNYPYQKNNLQAQSIGHHVQQPSPLPHPGNFNTMNNHLQPNMGQPAHPFSQNQNQGSYNTMQNVNMGQPQNANFTQLQDTIDYLPMNQRIQQGYSGQQQRLGQGQVYQNHPQQQGNYGHRPHPQFQTGQQPSNPFANVEITQGPPISTQNLAYVDPVATSAPRFHQTPPKINPDDPAGNWDLYLDAEEQAKNNMRKRSLTSAHPEMGPNNYRNPTMGMGMGMGANNVQNQHYLVGEFGYASNDEAWSGAPRGAPKRMLIAPQFNQQQGQLQNYSQQLMNTQQMSLQLPNSQFGGPPQMATPQMTPRLSPGQMGPPGFTQISGRNRSMSRASSVTSPNLLGRKNSTSSRSSKASPAHSRSASTGVSKRETGPTKRSSFSKPVLKPSRVAVPGWASTGSNTRRPSVTGGTKESPIRVSTSPVGLTPNNDNKEMMKSVMALISPEMSTNSEQELTLPSPEMLTADRSVDFLKDALLGDPNVAISDLDISPTQESQLSNLLQAQVHLSLLTPPQAPSPSLESPLETAVEIQEEGEVKELMSRLIRALQTGVDGLVNVAKVEDKADVDVSAARDRMKQALGDLVGEMGKVLGFGVQERWDPDMSEINAILEGWAPEGGNMDDLLGEGFGNENSSADMTLE